VSERTGMHVRKRVPRARKVSPSLTQMRGHRIPECCEARTMPSKDSLRLNDMRGAEQARPKPGHPDPQGPVTAAQPKTTRRTPQGDAELMAKEQVLHLKPAGRLEEVDDEHCERMQERENHPRSCDASTPMRLPSRMGFSERTGVNHASSKESGDDAQNGIRAGR